MARDRDPHRGVLLHRRATHADAPRARRLRSQPDDGAAGRALGICLRRGEDRPHGGRSRAADSAGAPARLRPHPGGRAAVPGAGGLWRAGCLRIRASERPLGRAAGRVSSPAGFYAKLLACRSFFPMLEPTPLYGGNAAFLDALHEQYLLDPASVGERWRAYFAQLAPAGAERAHGPIRAEIARRAAQGRAAALPAAASGANAQQAAVSRLIQVWINRGHLLASIDPLGLSQRVRPRVLDLDYFGLTAADLDTEFFTGSRTDAVPKRMKLRDILAQLQYIYAGNVGAEFAHMSDSEERLWLQDEFQEGRLKHRFSPEEQRNILWQLTAAEGLERYLHTKYVGQKRFSLEGA